MIAQNNSKSADVARKLFEARVQKTPVQQLSKAGIQLSRLEAYAVQEAGILLRKTEKENCIGIKMGLTSEGKRRQMNLDSPLYGELTDRMQIKNEAHFEMAQLIHPKIEPEVAFLISKTLSGDVTREEVLAACDGVCACMEILDSRYEEFKYFSMEDVIADNSSSSHFVLGPWIKNFHEIDLKELKMEMSIDGKIVQEGISKEISGDPVQSVIELCRLLATRNRKLLAGTIVLAGAATAAVEMKPGQKIKLIVESLPAVSISIV